MDISQFVQILWLLPVLYLFDSTSIAAGDETDTDFDWDVDFDSFLESIDSMADMVTDYVGDESGCHYRCKNGKRTVKMFVVHVCLLPRTSYGEIVQSA